jgi:hypothetical protein
MCRIPYVLVCSGCGEMGRGEVEFTKLKMELTMMLLLSFGGAS